jgi:hypothetical protein
MSAPYTPNGPPEAAISRVDFDAVTALVARLERRITELESQPPEPATKTADFLARPEQTVVIEAPSSGIKCSIVKATKFNRGKTVQFIQRNANRVTIRAIDGTVNGMPFVVSNAPGTFYAVSDGQTGWLLDQGIGPSGVAGAPGTPGTAPPPIPPGLSASSVYAMQRSPVPFNVPESRTPQTFFVTMTGVLTDYLLPSSFKAGDNLAVTLLGDVTLNSIVAPSTGFWFFLSIQEQTGGDFAITIPDVGAGANFFRTPGQPFGGGAAVPFVMRSREESATLTTISLGTIASTSWRVASATSAQRVTGDVEIAAGNGGTRQASLTSSGRVPPGLSLSQIYATLPGSTIPGAPGAAGLAGTTGATGATGPRGFNGEDGEDGQDGLPGRAGDTGPTGPTGPSGSGSGAVALAPPCFEPDVAIEPGEYIPQGWGAALRANPRTGGSSPTIDSGQRLILQAPGALLGAITSNANLVIDSDVQIFNSSPSFAWSISSGTENFRFRGAAAGCGIQLQRCAAPVSAPEATTALLWFKTESNAERAMARTLNSTGVTLTDWPLDCTGQVGRTTVTTVSAATTLLDLCGTYTIESNLLIVGSVWRAIGTFVFARGATATGVNALVTFRVGAANITATLTGLLATSGTNTVFKCEAQFTVLSTGVGTCSAVLTAYGATNTGAGALSAGAFNSALAITTTGTVAVSMDVQMSAIVASTSITATGGVIERVR